MPRFVARRLARTPEGDNGIPLGQDFWLTCEATPFRKTTEGLVFLSGKLPGRQLYDRVVGNSPVLLGTGRYLVRTEESVWEIRQYTVPEEKPVSRNRQKLLARILRGDPPDWLVAKQEREDQIEQEQRRKPFEHRPSPR